VTSTAILKGHHGGGPQEEQSSPCQLVVSGGEKDVRDHSDAQLQYGISSNFQNGKSLQV